MIAGTAEEYLTWCRRNKLSPHNETLTAITEESDLELVPQLVSELPPNAELYLAPGWQNLLACWPHLVPELLVCCPGMQGLQKLRAFAYGPSQDR